MSDDGEEVIWATSTTGDDFRCVHVDGWRIAKARIAELEAALRPFAVFGKNVDDNGWTSTIHRESISTWFGPSDFRAARVLMPQAKD